MGSKGSKQVKCPRGCVPVQQQQRPMGMMPMMRPQMPMMQQYQKQQCPMPMQVNKYKRSSSAIYYNKVLHL